MPVEKSEGKSVFAGTINQSGVLHVSVASVGRDTSFGKIVEAAEQAERSKAPIQKTADRLDQVRPEAQQAVHDLEAMSITTVLLTGDSSSSATAVAKRLGVKIVHAELLPEQKRERVREVVRNKLKVAMVGDGINDAPALAEASLGVAMGSGTDVARESADVVLIGNDLSRFVEALRIARRCRGIIMQNFYGTLAVDAVGIVLAAIGLLNPLFAAFIHVSSELAFILNSTRMLPRDSHRKSDAPEVS